MDGFFTEKYVHSTQFLPIKETFFQIMWNRVQINTLACWKEYYCKRVWKLFTWNNFYASTLELLKTTHVDFYTSDFKIRRSFWLIWMINI